MAEVEWAETLRIVLPASCFFSTKCGQKWPFCQHLLANLGLFICKRDNRPTAQIKSAANLVVAAADLTVVVGLPLALVFCVDTYRRHVCHNTTLMDANLPLDTLLGTNGCCQTTSQQKDMSLPEPSVSFFTAKTALVLAGVWLVYKLLEAAYNVSPLHPLSHVPGPKLAAATYLPEFYHDVVLFGRYTNQIRRMHEQYGEWF